MPALRYPANFEPDEDGRILVSFPDLPRVRTDGKDNLEAMEEAIDCLGSHIAFEMHDRRDLPRPSRSGAGAVLVPVPLWIAPQFALYSTMRAQKVSNSELARRLGVSENAVRRLLNPNHTSKPGKLEMALAALGCRLEVSVTRAA